MSKDSKTAIIGTVAIASGIYMLYYLMWKKLPRGYRNNNPLNIRINPANNWVGKVKNNTDGVFEQFTSIKYGYRAALVLLRNYIRNGNTTIQQIISRWAPTNENYTTSYIKHVCTTMGATPSTVIDASSVDQMASLVYAMAIVENGNTPAPNMQDIYAGWNLI